MTAIQDSTDRTGIPTLAQQVEQGYSLLRKGRLADAVELGSRLASAHADSSHALVFASEASLANGDPEVALALIGKAIDASRNNLPLKIKKAHLLVQMRRRTYAMKLAAEAADQAGNDGRAIWQIGSIYNTCNNLAAALAQYEKARGLMGDHPGLLYDLAVAQFFTGDFENADHNLDRMLAAAPQAGHALYLRSTLQRQTRDRNHVEDLERRLKAGLRNPAAEASCSYALAKELEDLGEHERSFLVLSSAAAKKRSTLQYDVSAECAALQAIRTAYTAEAMNMPVQGHGGEGAIFIVGMPRTGTTLVERMLIQSGEVKSAGELLDFGNLLAAATQKHIAANPALSPAEASRDIDFAALGRDYMQGARQAAGDNPLFIDKMPINYLYCGLIRKALPNAKIIHLARDPLDSCYAVYKTLFFNAYHFSYDLDELAEYYIAYHEMMRHWHAVMPGSILDVRYEDLVTDTENQARRIFAWCSLEWDASVLESSPGTTSFATASAAQVREPVHSRSVHSSRKHEEKLAPLISKLAAAGILPA